MSKEYSATAHSMLMMIPSRMRDALSDAIGSIDPRDILDEYERRNPTIWVVIEPRKSPANDP